MCECMIIISILNVLHLHTNVFCVCVSYNIILLCVMQTAFRHAVISVVIKYMCAHINVPKTNIYEFGD